MRLRRTASAFTAAHLTGGQKPVRFKYKANSHCDTHQWRIGHKLVFARWHLQGDKSLVPKSACTRHNKISMLNLMAVIRNKIEAKLLDRLTYRILKYGLHLDIWKYFRHIPRRGCLASPRTHRRTEGASCSTVRSGCQRRCRNSPRPS